MFGLLKAKNPHEQAAGRAYAGVLAQARNPVFYRDCGVADTFEGRFDLLLLHLFIVMQGVRNGAGGAQADAFNQALFDAAFADMDQMLRETGIGDMGVPKRMRRMMKACNGRLHAYAAARDDTELEQALRRNLYGTDARPGDLRRMKNYVQAGLDLIKDQAVSILRDGNVSFAVP